MAPLTSKERQKKYREKLQRENPEKFEKLKKENAERNKKRYQETKNLPENKRNLKRKYYKKEENIWETEESPERKKSRYILSMYNSTLETRIDKMKNIIETQRKTIYRYKKKMENLQKYLDKVEEEFADLRKLHEDLKTKTTPSADTPSSKSEQLIQETIPNVPVQDKDRVRKAIFEGYVLKQSISSQYSETKSKMAKTVLRNLVNNYVVKKYNLKKKLSYSCLGLKGNLREKRKVLENKKIMRMKEIESFLERDDNSRITAGKKETRSQNKEKKQVRYLLDSLEKLHRKYKEEGGTASYTVFTRYRPFYILDPKISQRNTCACVRHANLTFLAQKLKFIGILETDNLETLVSTIVCDKFNQKCMYNECENCEKKTFPFDLAHKDVNTSVSWNAWVTKTHEYTKVKDNQDIIIKTKKTTKDTIQGTVTTLIESFNDQLEKFKKHFFNIYHAYQTYKTCKDTLNETECIIHCDFSENYTCKSSEEVQATHFGASKQQFTLHTGVIYYKNEHHLKEKSFCTLSDNNNHSPTAIWGHLMPILEYIRKSLLDVTTLHFFSDGPTTQYRQKGNFYLLSEYMRMLGFQKSTWTFFESAHGKGAADGIGGAVKRTLDKKVAHGEDVVDALTAYEILKKCQSKIMYYYISNENFRTVEHAVDLTGLIPAPRTMEIHQVITTEQVNVIKFRKLACFCKLPCCECFGLEEHNLKIKRTTRQKQKKDDNKHIIKKTKTRQNVEKTRKKSIRANESDTSIDSHITYAESDDSMWNPEDELDDPFEENESNKPHIVVHSTENTAKNINKKVTILSDIKNTPDNRKYFNLNNYGPLTLHKIDVHEVNISEIPTKSDVSRKRRTDDRNEGQQKRKLSKYNEKRTISKENILEDNMTENPEQMLNRNAMEENTNVTEERGDTKEDDNGNEQNEPSGLKSFNYPATISYKEQFCSVEMEINAETNQNYDDTEKVATEGGISINEEKDHGNDTTPNETDEPNNQSTTSYVKQPCTSNQVGMKSRTIVTKKDSVPEQLSMTETRYDTEEHENYERQNETDEPNITEGLNISDIKYKINDSVLVRYYQKKTWIYYVGFIKEIKNETNVIYYTIDFFKTVKKPHLKFKSLKKIDRDIVPADCVVKVVDLNLVANDFVLKDNADRIYFS